MIQHIIGSPATGELKIPDGDWVAFAIGPESDYAEVRINGRLCAAGRVLPLEAKSATVAFERGPVTTTHNAHVIAFGCGAQVVNPGPRPAREYVFPQRQMAAWDAGMDNARVMVVPFVGRRAARIFVNVLGSEDIAWVAYLRKYTPAIGGISGAQESLYLELPAEEGFDKATPHVASNGAGTDTPDGANIGGTDHFESADELVIYAQAAQGENGGEEASASAIFYVNVIGEEGCG